MIMTKKAMPRPVAPARERMRTDTERLPRGRRRERPHTLRAEIDAEPDRAGNAKVHRAKQHAPRNPSIV